MWLVLAGCRPDPHPRPPPAAEDTGGDTEVVGPAPYCVTEHDVTAGTLLHGWVSPSGTLYASGLSPSTRVRAPDGAWSLDPMDPIAPGFEQIDGADDASVWARGADVIRRRAPDGTWTPMHAPLGRGEQTVGLEVFADDDVSVVVAATNQCADCALISALAVLHWDGVGWTRHPRPEVRGWVEAVTVLPDRTVVLAADGHLRSIAGPPIPAPLYVRSVAAAPDGTLVAVGSTHVAIGTADGLSLRDPDVEVDEWVQAWAGSSTDVWVSGQRWVGRTSAVVAHWDGVQWTEVLSGELDEQYRLTGRDGTVYAFGIASHERVLHGDAGGFTLDREAFGPGTQSRLTVDDQTGAAWSMGFGGDELGAYRDGGWHAVVLPDPTIDPNWFAVSDQRLVLGSSEWWWVLEPDGAWTTTPNPDGSHSRLAAADGVLFAIGPSGVWRHAGAGWALVPGSAPPAELELTAAWADDATTAWLGYGRGRTGGVARWDGVEWTLYPLEAAPGWLARLSDGRLYVTQEGTPAPAVVFDGPVSSEVPDLPWGVRGLHLTPDGTWFAAVREPDGERRSLVLQRDPGGAWVEVVADTATMVGAGDTVWVSEGLLGWVRAPCGD